MSYEGYELWLCQEGHISRFDCYATPNVQTWKCPYCGNGLESAEPGYASIYAVDETNGAPSCVDFSVDQISPETDTTPGRYKITTVPVYWWNHRTQYPNINFALVLNQTGDPLENDETLA